MSSWRLAASRHHKGGLRQGRVALMLEAPADLQQQLLGAAKGGMQAGSAPHTSVLQDPHLTHLCCPPLFLFPHDAQHAASHANALRGAERALCAFPCAPPPSLLCCPLPHCACTDAVLKRVRMSVRRDRTAPEYALLNVATKWPLGWPKGGYPAVQGPYYCSAGAGVSIARDVCEVHYRLCLYAGLEISGINGEVLPSQWEYQVGPCTGIDMGDQLWMSRYIMHRVCEMFNVECTFDPKPVPGDWNGSGGHVNFSTKATRTAPGGWDVIQEHCKKLEKRHAIHIAVYGEGNERRLTGKHETSSMNDFAWGVANRGCSIRVSRMTPVDKCGYYEDRRPASNLDPYVVTKMLVESTLLM
eukprot:354903-Chlamydomonas_euryale.AAC.21